MKVTASPAWELRVWEFLTRQRYGPITAQTMPGHDEPAELCPKCGQPVGHGTLLDASPVPPWSAELVWHGGRVPARVWRPFASRYRCPSCVALAGVVRVQPGGWAS
jgi:hypothetical protein